MWNPLLRAEVNKLASRVSTEWPEKLSESYVQERIEGLALKTVTQPVGQETWRCFEGLFTELDLFQERKLCIAAVEGIGLISDDAFRIGPFLMRRATRCQLDRIHALTKDALGRTLHSSEEQTAIASCLNKDAEDGLLGSVLLELELTADAAKAHALFFEKAGTLMDLLQMSTTIAEWCGSARVGLRGHPHAGAYSAWILPINPGNFLQPNKRIGSVGELCLSDGNLFLMKRAGVMRLAEALGRKATELESALLRAAHWYAQATLQDHEGQDILCLILCLESALSFRLSSARAIAESVALLVECVTQIAH